MSENIDWGEHVENTEDQSKEQLNIISELAADMLQLEAEIEEVEQLLKEKKQAHLKIAQGSLPEAMLALGLTELKHISGAKLSVETFYQAKIPVNKEKEAYAYLERTGNDAIIKTDLTAKFGKGEKEEAERIFNVLKDHGVIPAMKTGIHHSTLRAFVKEQIESGTDLPLEAFGVYVGNKIKVK